MAMKMRWLGTACFEIVLPSGKTVVLDPYLDDAYSAPIGSDQIEGCDYLFITHGHYDHVADAGKIAERFSPQIFCNTTTAGILTEHQGVDSDGVTSVRAGDEILRADLSAQVVEGVHADMSQLRIPSHKKQIVRIPAGGFDTGELEQQLKIYPGGEHLNFVFDPKGGRRIYMAGTYPDPSLLPLAQRAEAHITLLQIMSSYLLAGLEAQIIQLAKASGCRILIPQHHDPLEPSAPKADLTRFKQMVESTSEMTLMELVPGKWYDFG